MRSLLAKQEVSRARVGPRELKDPRSRAYAIQTVYALKRYSESLRCDRVRVAKELAKIERYQHWKVLGYPSKQALLDAELTAQGVANVQATLDEAPDMPGQGARLDLRLPSNRRKLREGTTREYLAARLKRDYPAICVRIEAGEFRSIRAAAIAAGIIKTKTPLDELRRWWRKASRLERELFHEEIHGDGTLGTARD